MTDDADPGGPSLAIGATPDAPQPHGASPPAGTQKPLKPAQKRAAAAVARGWLRTGTIEGAAAEAGCSPSTVQRLRRHPDYHTAEAGERERLRRLAELESEAGRVEALQAARAIVRRYTAGEAPVSASDAIAAARLLESASAPPSERARVVARREERDRTAPHLTVIDRALRALRRTARDTATSRLLSDIEGACRAMRTDDASAWAAGLSDEQLEAAERGEEIPR